MDEGDAAAKAGEKVRLFHGRVAAADDDNFLVAVEEAVAGGAGADTVSDELLFARQVEPAGRGAGGDDQRTGFHPVSVDADPERAFAQVGLRDRAVMVNGAKALRLAFHVLNEFGALNAIGKARKVLYFSGKRELAAGFVAADDGRLQARAGGVDGGRISGATGADDDYVMHDGRRPSNLT
jgi:hypothetical protein